MRPDACTRIEPFQIVVSADRLRAWIHQPSVRVSGYRPPSADEVLAALEASKIIIDDAVRKRLEEFVALTGAAQAGPHQPELPQRYLIAEGVFPVEPTDATFEWSPELAPAPPRPADDGPVDYFALTTIRTVPADAFVGRIQPPSEGRPGRDLLGRVVQPSRRHGSRIELGPGLRLGADGTEVRTERPGRVVLNRNKLTLEEVLNIAGDVDLKTGSLEVCVDVNVRGTVRSNFHVRTSGAVHVDQAVEAAVVEAGGDVVVRGGICGGDADDTTRGRIDAGGTITVRFCNEVVLRAAGDIRVEKEVLNSRVQTTGRFLSQAGTIIGGVVWARAGLEVRVLGSDIGTQTRVLAGYRPDVLHRARRMDRDAHEARHCAAQIREKVQPLLTNLKRLTPQQREMATELMSRADEFETGAERLLGQREQLLALARPPAPPFILVHALINPGVRLILNGRETRVDNPIPGPVHLEERKLEGATEVVCVNQLTGSVTVLPAAEAALNSLPLADWELPGDFYADLKCQGPSHAA